MRSHGPEGDTINKIMGEILEDMTMASREKIEKYTAPIGGAEEEENTMNLESRDNGDWVFLSTRDRIRSIHPR